MTMRRPIRIGVIGSAQATELAARLARTIGAALAHAEAVLVCGGRGGVMAAAAAGAAEEGGIVIGLLPGEEAALLDELKQVMQASGPAEREALQLRLTGETVESIAQSMGRSQRTVRRLLQASRQELERRFTAAETE